MKFKSILLSLSIFAIFAISFDASAKKAKNKKGTKKMKNSEKAKNVLEKARETTISTISKNNRQAGEINYITTIWNKYYPDGTSANRYETIGKLKKTGKKVYHKIYLTKIDDSDWEIIGDIAIKREDINHRSKSHKINNNEKNEFLYQIKNVVFFNKPCFKITVTDKNHSILKDEEIATTCYYIDRKDFFIYAREHYMKSGVKIPSFPADSIQKVKPDNIDDSLFEVPKNCSIYIVKDSKTGDLLYQLALEKQKTQLIPKYKLDDHFQDEFNSSDIDEILSKFNNNRGDK